MVWDYLSASAHSELGGQHVRFWNQIIVNRSTDEDVSVLLDGFHERLPALRSALERNLLDRLPVTLLARGFGCTRRRTGDSKALRLAKCWLIPRLGGTQIP